MTELAKRYDHKEIEPKWRAYWEEKQVNAFKYDESKPTYVIDTPPPYVSAAHLHSGHIMSFSQAEFFARYRRMRGYNVFYTMGFDDNGLPTERYVEKKHNINKSKITKREFVELCLKETKEGSQNYIELWKTMGLSLDWSKTYSTINPTATKVSQWSLIDLWKKGALERKEMPILWCTHCQTALAQADLEDQEEMGMMHYINFADAEGNPLLIATTRPELIPAVVAVYTNPEDERFKHLIGTEATVPFVNTKVPIKASDKVDPEKGTGIMMVSTWGDVEDVEKWQLDKLETRQILGVNGVLNELAGEFEGMHFKKARKAIVEKAQELGIYVRGEEREQVKNIHDRCKTPVDFIASKQWFIKLTDKKEEFLELGRKLNWYPAHYRRDYETWVNGLKWDWCISRQRFYGVPFPLWYCKGCEEPVFAEEEQLPVEPSTAKPPVENCPSCAGKEFVPEEDVMDTWATSSCTPFLLRELVDDPKIKEDMFPVGVRPNAHEIIRTWDFYSVVKSYYHFGDVPFRDVMISGHGTDEQGRKISKSLGNYTPPMQLVEEHGADAIRFWATGANLGENLKFQPAELKVGKKLFNKLWNVAKLLQMHTPESGVPVAQSLEAADVWALTELKKTIELMEKYMDEYEFAHARQALSDFFWNIFADRYIEFIKYRLWGEEGKSKDAAIHTLATLFEGVLKLFAPFFPYVTEEIYHGLFMKEGEESIHLTSWPVVTQVETSILDGFDRALETIEAIKKYKADNQLSIGAELETMPVESTMDEERFGEFVRKVMRIEG